MSANDTIPQEKIDALLARAWDARKNSYSPYSNFAVGAALLTEDGEIVTGCNVECATYSHTLCAERAALARAVGDGHRSFVAVAVVAEAPDPPSPCGGCRQLLAEFSPDMLVVYANREHVTRRTLAELLPDVFDSRMLPPKADE